MDTLLIRILQLVMSLSLLVVIHEGGHFFFARLFKVRVEKFYVFFDPWFSLLKFKPKNSETEYGIGWLPLGGYCKIAGMIDESMDTEQMKQPAQPWEFRAKPAWQRLLIMVGGVTFNFLLALVIYSMILFTWGEQFFEVSKAPIGMDFNQTAHEVGFQDGDVLLEADGIPFERFDGDMLRQVVNAKVVTVNRHGEKVAVYIPEDMMQRLMNDTVRFASFRVPYVIDSVAVNSPAMEAGLQSGDRILTMDGREIAFYDFLEEMNARKSKSQALADSDSIDLRAMTLTYERAGKIDTVSLRANEDFKIGVYAAGMNHVLPLVTRNYGFFESFPAGIRLGVNTLTGYVSDMKYLFSKEGAKQIGGFGTIGKLFPSEWNWYQFWYMTAFISIMLAFMNILPIPALDGGHVLFLLYEVITRRKPSDKFMEYAQVTGMILLFGLLIWANLNDVIRYIF